MPKGRPKKDETRLKQFRIRLYPDEHERLKKMAADSGMSISDLIKTGIESIAFGNKVFRLED